MRVALQSRKVTIFLQYSCKSKKTSVEQQVLVSVSQLALEPTLKHHLNTLQTLFKTYLKHPLKVNLTHLKKQKETTVEKT